MSPVRIPSQGVRLARACRPIDTGSRPFQAQWRFPMTHSHRDDSPADFSLFRRKILIGGGVILGALAAPSIATPAADPTQAAYPGRFLELSALLIQHRLDREVGLRLPPAPCGEGPNS